MQSSAFLHRSSFVSQVPAPAPIACNPNVQRCDAGTEAAAQAVAAAQAKEAASRLTMGKIADPFRDQSISLAGQQRAKMLSLDRQFEEIEAERDALKTENLQLKAQVNPLQEGSRAAEAAHTR